MSYDVSADVARRDSEPSTTDRWRRLSPRMLLIHPVRELGRALPGLAALLVAGSSSGHGALWGFIGAAVVSGFSVTRWFTTSFRVRADQVQIREGLLRRRTLAARLDRVRTVDVTSSALHRALGLARVEIGTGVSDLKGKSALRLDGLSAEEAARLRGELLHRSPVAQPVSGVSERSISAAPDLPDAGASVGARGSAAEAPPEVEIARLRAEWIRFAPFTLSGAFTGLAIAGFGWRIVSEGQVDIQQVGPVHSVANQLSGIPLWVSVLEGIVGVVLFVALASTAGYVLAFWNFRLTRHRAGSFHVSRGLLTTRATSIDVSRLRGVVISETLLMRVVGGARTLAVATGLDVRRNAPATRSGTVLLPDAPRATALEVAAQVLAAPDVMTAGLDDHGPTARRRRFTRALGATAVLLVVVELVLAGAGPFGWAELAALVLLLPAVPLAADRARSLGHAVRSGYLVVQSGSLIRRRVALETDAIIGWNLRQSFFQRRARVATLVATTAAGRQSYRLLDLPLGEVRVVADQATPGLLGDFSAASGDTPTIWGSQPLSEHDHLGNGPGHGG